MFNQPDLEHSQIIEISKKNPVDKHETPNNLTGENIGEEQSESREELAGKKHEYLIQKFLHFTSTCQNHPLISNA